MAGNNIELFDIYRIIVPELIVSNDSKKTRDSVFLISSDHSNFQNVLNKRTFYYYWM